MSMQLNRYIRKVQAYLPCGIKAKKQITNEIRSSLCAYLEQNPSANADSICQRFGTPQQIAASYVDEMDTAELLRSLRIRRKIVAALVLTIVAALIIFTVFLTITVIIAHNDLTGYTVVTIP